MEQKKLQRRLAAAIFTVAFLAQFYLLGAMMWPFLSAVVFGFILAGIFAPLMDRLTSRGLGRPLSAAIVCLVVVGAVFLPAVGLVVRISQEALLLYDNVKDSLDLQALQGLLFGKNAVAAFFGKVAELAGIDYNWEAVQALVVGAAQAFSLGIFETLNGWIGNVFTFLIQFLLMLILIYGVLVDGPRLKDFLLDLSPLPNADEELIIVKFNQMSYVTLVCNGLGGVIQGILAGFGFWLADIGSVLLWTTVMIVLAFIPLVGMSIVYVPACIYLYADGHGAAAVLLFVYCTFVAMAVENGFKPWFMGGRVEMNSIVIFFAILGGMGYFGIAGIFYGPLLITIFLTFVQLYHERYVPRESVRPLPPGGG